MHCCCAAGFLACWEILYLLVGEDVVSSPSATIVRAASLLQTQNFWRDAESTGIAFAYACLIGIGGGLLLGPWSWAQSFRWRCGRSDPRHHLFHPQDHALSDHPVDLRSEPGGKGRVRSDPRNFSRGHFHDECCSQRRAGPPSHREGVAAVAAGDNRDRAGAGGHSGNSFRRAHRDRGDAPGHPDRRTFRLVFRNWICADKGDRHS